jgi:hypothetical protein
VAIFAIWEIVRHYREKARDSEPPLIIEMLHGLPQGTRTVWPSDPARSARSSRVDLESADTEFESARVLGPWTVRQPNTQESAPQASPEPVRQPSVESAPAQPAQPVTFRAPTPARDLAPPPSPPVVRPVAPPESVPPPSAVVVPVSPPAASVPNVPAVPERPSPRDVARASNREGTRVLMPGRLEFLSGNDPRKEIRFVQVDGTDAVTFGRYEGEAYTHVRLDSPTVSRMHASMRFVKGYWFIRNLSATNPVVLNGERLLVEEGEQQLHDGDRVEMGDVIFRFRSR